MSVRIFLCQQPIGPMAAVMMEDFRKTGQCNFGLAQKSFDNYHQSWMIRKGDPMIEIFNKGYSVYY